MRMPLSSPATRGGAEAASLARVPGSHRRPASRGRDGSDTSTIIKNWSSSGLRGTKSRACREIGVAPVGEPDEVRPARVRPGGVEVRQPGRARGVAHVIEIHPRMGLARLRGLVRDRQGRAGEAERVAADEVRLHVNLRDDGRVFGGGHVDEEKYAPPVRVLPQRQPLAALAGAVQVAAADDLHVARRGGGERAVGGDGGGAAERREVLRHRFLPNGA
jgi:hypothetical protein